MNSSLGSRRRQDGEPIEIVNCSIPLRQVQQARTCGNERKKMTGSSSSDGDIILVSRVQLSPAFVNLPFLSLSRVQSYPATLGQEEEGRKKRAETTGRRGEEEEHQHQHQQSASSGHCSSFFLFFQSLEEIARVWLDFKPSFPLFWRAQPASQPAIQPARQAASQRQPCLALQPCAVQ